MDLVKEITLIAKKLVKKGEFLLDDRAKVLCVFSEGSIKQ